MSERRHRDPVVRYLWKLQDLVSKHNVPDEIKLLVDSILGMQLDRDQYSDEKSTQASPELKYIYDFTMSHPWEQVFKDEKLPFRVRPTMISGFLEVQFLKSLISMINARKVLEVGSFTGFGALGMAEAVPEDGTVVTCEIQPYLQELARKNVDRSPHGKKITIKLGDAVKTLRQMATEGQKFDLIFMDGNKDGYPEIYKIVFEHNLLSPNGTLVVDNAFYQGSAYVDDGYVEGSHTRRFNDIVCNDTSVHKVLVPLKDGVWVIRRVECVEKRP